MRSHHSTKVRHCHPCTLDLDDGDGRIVTHRLAAGDTMIYSTAIRHRWHHRGADTTRFVHVSAPASVGRPLRAGSNGGWHDGAADGA